nr:MAG TPA: hypothetical protein [Caudoviricetes sp.]
MKDYESFYELFDIKSQKFIEYQYCESFYELQQII